MKQCYRSSPNAKLIIFLCPQITWSNWTSSQTLFFLQELNTPHIPYKLLSSRTCIYTCFHTSHALFKTGQVCNVYQFIVFVKLVTCYLAAWSMTRWWRLYFHLYSQHYCLAEYPLSPILDQLHLLGLQAPSKHS